jgi:hypothetical protein
MSKNLLDGIVRREVGTLAVVLVGLVLALVL